MNPKFPNCVPDFFGRLWPWNWWANCLSEAERAGWRDVADVLQLVIVGFGGLVLAWYFFVKPRAEHREALKRAREDQAIVLAPLVRALNQHLEFLGDLLREENAVADEAFIAARPLTVVQEIQNAFQQREAFDAGTKRALLSLIGNGQTIRRQLAHGIRVEPVDGINRIVQNPRATRDDFNLDIKLIQHTGSLAARVYTRLRKITLGRPQKDVDNPYWD